MIGGAAIVDTRTALAAPRVLAALGLAARLDAGERKKGRNSLGND